MEEKRTYQAEIMGLDGGLLMSPIYETRKEADKFIIKYLGEEGEKFTLNRTKHAAVITRFYENDLISLETKSYFYEW